MNGDLTQKQENFCLAYVTSPGLSASDAYKSAYNTENMKPATINRKAFALMENGKIRARIAELRAEPAKNAKLTLESHLEDLKKLRDSAAEIGNFSAAVNAEVARGKASGLYENQNKVDVSGGLNITISYGDEEEP